MDKATRNTIERATQQARKLLDEDFSSQLEGTFDVLRSGVIAPQGGAHLSVHQQSHREKVVAAIEHKRAFGMSAQDAIADYVRDAAFTTLNRFVALKMLEARVLVQECITRGEQSAGYREFCGMAPGVALLPDATGYHLYIESLFDEFSTEIKVLFDRRSTASILWPKRQAFETLLTILNSQELSAVWGEDETIGWFYQFFNSGDERRKMREESQVPRNSRELAVRNQFFTPRYVVQFLADNTLGRLWVEMYGDKTRLNAKCEYLVRPFAERVQTRLSKDPRDLRILDPACGSGHFLLYSFDLLLVIYEEAWSVESNSPASVATGRKLRDDYPDLASLRRDAPRLIIENNLYGVDIDARCSQIAALALWLRAQRAWKDIGVAASERPTIQRTHIVVAEPMPGDPKLVEEFAIQLEPPLLRDLFKKMIDESHLAGELGVLLRLEDAIAGELHSAREQFVQQRQTTGFLPGLEPLTKQGVLDLSGIDDDRFFHEAEARIVEALRGFAETRIGAASVRRRLFAGDAAEGVALIDLVRTRFDVVLMNPPFGAGSLAAKKEFEKSYPRTKNDVYAAFVERGIQLLHSGGLLGAITSRTGFFLSTFQQWREEILLKEAPPIIFADLGYGVLDSAIVEVAAYCLEAGSDSKGLKTTFFRTLGADDKAAALRGSTSGHTGPGNAQRFDVELDTLRQVPGSPFSYWVPQKLRSVFQKMPAFESDGRIARAGAATIDDVRFTRLWFEVTGEAWVPLAKGGKNAPFYADIHLVVQWSGDGAELKAFAGAYRERKGWGDQWTAVLNGYALYFRPGLTWPHRSATFSVSPLPAGCIFTKSGKAGFAPSDQLGFLLGILNAAPATLLLRVQSDAVRIKFEAGLVGRLPIPNVAASDAAQFAGFSRRAWSLKRGLDVHNETSHAFILPALLLVDGGSLATRAAAWREHVGAIETELGTIQAQIDRRCFDLYDLDEADRRAITEGFGTGTDEPEEPDDTEADVEGDAEDNAGGSAGTEDLAAELVSWAVGAAFGRFDVELATGVRVLPLEPDPFDALPACSSAMLTGDNGLSLASAPSGYSVAFPENGVLVGDPGHARDLPAAVRAVFDKVFTVNADMWWSEVGSQLGPKSNDLQSWLGTTFFENHLKRYSKSRRKAPIIWQLSVPSGRYSVWLYAHRLTRDSFFQIQNDLVIPKVAHEERQLTSLIQGAGGNPSAKERKEIAAQEGFVEELRAFLEDVKRVAPLWNPKLDDGVVLTMAPLWRLAPQHRPWQKELKAKWYELAAGKYDWANIAMHLWPERVVPKCAADRSYAIAHGLEDCFWIKGEDGKWNSRSTPIRPVEDLVRERTSIAVKAALKSLIEAPIANMNGAGRRGRRAANVAGDGGAR